MKMHSTRITRFNVVLAFCLFATGLLVNPLSLGYLVQVSFGLMGKMLIVAFEIFLIISGLLVYFKGNTVQERKHLAFGYIAFALVIIIVESGLQITNYAIHQFDQVDQVDKFKQEQEWLDRQCSLSPYAGKEWARTYWKEVLASSWKDYKPFLGWGEREYHGEYINNNAEGVRKTWNPENSNGKTPDTIYVFGGSSLWGYGARDEYTIPSYLCKLLNNNGYDFTVYNYGERGHAFTQEIIHLILLLKDGHRPRYVIFYDGINNVDGSYYSGIPGVSYRFLLIDEKMKAKLPSEVPILRIIYNRVVYGIFTEHSMIYKSISYIFALISPQSEFQADASKYNDEELQLLSYGIFEDYLKAMDLLAHLSQAYDFEYLCFWQPFIYTERTLTDEETITASPWLKDKAFGELYRLTTNYLSAESPPHFFNITDVLYSRTKTYYIDHAHLSEEGNEVVATKIFQIFEKEFLQE